jgi:hypothetical protein
MYNTTVRLATLEAFKQGGVGEPSSDEQEELLWHVADEAFALYASGKLNTVQAGQVALAWKGTTNVFGWKGVAPTLPPSVRAGIAYVLGFRYRKIGKPKEAADFFQTAIDNAGENRILQRLAEEELRGSSEAIEK